MSTYKAKVYSSDKRFHGMPLLFDSHIPVSENTKLAWLEPLKDDASDEEIEWYNKVLKLVVQDA